MPDTVRSSLEVGSIVAGTYTLEALIGRGGMGSVYLASHARLPGKQVALKFLHADAGDGEALARFRREAEIASRLGHPNIIQIHDYNTLPDGTPYLVLEYLVGETLAARLARGPLAVAAAFAIVRQVGGALAVAHRGGIVHRDLKPGNIFLVASERDGVADEVAKLLDFGISKIRGSTTVNTKESSLLGTPQYMAPEQATGNHDEVDERTDVFAFGTIVYEMLGGKPAFAGASIPEVMFKVVYEQPVPLREVAPALAPPITDAVARAMAKQARDRFATVSDFVEALTGRPLSMVSRPPAVSTAARSAVATAATATPATPLPAGIAAGIAAVDANAETVATADTGAGRPRKRWFVAAPVIALAGAAAIYLGIGRGDGREPARVDAAVMAAAVARDAGAVAVVAEVADAEAAAPRDAAVAASAADASIVAAPARDAARPVVAAHPVVGSASDDRHDARLAAAEHALATGDLDGAAKLAYEVAIDPTAATADRDQARGLRGQVACSKYYNLSEARGELREIKSSARARARIFDACRSAGYPLDGGAD